MSDDDKDFYSQAMQDVNRSHKNYKNNKVVAPRPLKQSPVVRSNTSFSKTPKRTPAIAQPSAIEQTDGDAILFIRAGLQKNSQRQLKRGEFEIDDILDLHGLRSWEAEQALENFIAHSLDNQYQYVMIIHGKGYRSENHQSVLKPLTIKYLKEQPEVLGFCSAQPQDGGTGALYVRLKRS